MIVVMGDVKISPPYLPDNCVGRSDSAVERLKLMVSPLIIVFAVHY